MDVHSYIAICSQYRFASMQADTYSYSGTLRPGMIEKSTLNSYRSVDCTDGTIKGDEEGISLGIDLVAILLDEHLSQ
jgi:hypothetical protein